MNIRTEINGKILYIEDMDGLTCDGSISSPTRITLSEQGGDVILSAIHYGDFEGLIHLDLAKQLKEYVRPQMPDDEWYSSDAQTLQLTFKVANASYVQEYSFDLNVFSRDALTMMTDIDALAVPMCDMLPMPVTIHTTSDIANGYIETAYSLTELFTESCDYMGRGVSLKTAYINTLWDRQPFRILVEGEDTAVQRRSPIYTPTPGSFELYLFRNRFGALELFPMAGDLELQPDFQYDINKTGKNYISTLKSEAVTLTQYSGPITRQASKVLASMLLDGYAYHYANGEWKRIIITDAKISLKAKDTVHRQSFSFRYQEPVDIRDIII